MSKDLLKKLTKMTDVAHIIYGATSFFLIAAGYGFFGVIMIVCFGIYQFIDFLKGEDLEEVLTDIQEFLVGFMIALFMLGINIVGEPLLKLLKLLA